MKNKTNCETCAYYVYDEEFEYDVEYHHSIKVKSLQEYLAEHDKQVKTQICNEVREKFKEIIFDNSTIDEILDQIQGDKK